MFVWKDWKIVLEMLLKGKFVSFVVSVCVQCKSALEWEIMDNNNCICCGKLHGHIVCCMFGMK